MEQKTKKKKNIVKSVSPTKAEPVEVSNLDLILENRKLQNELFGLKEKYKIGLQTILKEGNHSEWCNVNPDDGLGCNCVLSEVTLELELLNKKNESKN